MQPSAPDDCPAALDATGLPEAGALPIGWTIHFDVRLEV